MRLAFKASTKYEDVPMDDNNVFSVKSYTDVLTPNGWVKAKDLHIGDLLVCEEDGKEISKKIIFIARSDVSCELEVMSSD